MIDLLYNRDMPTVQLFVTCLVDTFYPETAEAIVSILNRLGVSVDFPAALGPMTARNFPGESVIRASPARGVPGV